MARKNNRTCIVCAKEYSYCPTCSEDRKKEPWHNIYCCDNCKTIFETASDYLTKVITKEEAKTKFSACDLSRKETFHKKIVEAIEEVFKEEEILEKISYSKIKKSTDADKGAYKKTNIE